MIVDCLVLHRELQDKLTEKFEQEKQKLAAQAKNTAEVEAAIATREATEKAAAQVAAGS